MMRAEEGGGAAEDDDDDEAIEGSRVRTHTKRSRRHLTFFIQQAKKPAAGKFHHISDE
jgi:hypothetical protein